MNDDINMNEIMDEDLYRILKAEDLVKRLGIGRDRAYSLMKSDGFPSTKIGKRYFITERSLRMWLDKYAGKNFRM